MLGTAFVHFCEDSGLLPPADLQLVGRRVAPRCGQLAVAAIYVLVQDLGKVVADEHVRTRPHCATGKSDGGHRWNRRFFPGAAMMFSRKG